MPLPDEAKDLEVIYVGKGLRRSARNQLMNHQKLQEILADLASNESDQEVLALVYAFEKIHRQCSGVPPT